MKQYFNYCFKMKYSFKPNNIDRFYRTDRKI